MKRPKYFLHRVIFFGPESVSRTYTISQFVYFVLSRNISFSIEFTLVGGVISRLTIKKTTIYKQAQIGAAVVVAGARFESRITNFYLLCKKYNTYVLS